MIDKTPQRGTCSAPEHKALAYRYPNGHLQTANCKDFMPLAEPTPQTEAQPERCPECKHPFHKGVCSALSWTEYSVSVAFVPETAPQPESLKCQCSLWPVTRTRWMQAGKLVICPIHDEASRPSAPAPASASQSAEPPKKWSIEAGPISSEVAGGYVTVSYSIRAGADTLKIVQRVAETKEGYALAYSRIARIVGKSQAGAGDSGEVSTPHEDEYVAWAYFDHRNPQVPELRLCDSDFFGAFKLYRWSTVEAYAAARLAERDKLRDAQLVDKYTRGMSDTIRNLQQRLAERDELLVDKICKYGDARCVQLYEKQEAELTALRSEKAERDKTSDHHEQELAALGERLAERDKELEKVRQRLKLFDETFRDWCSMAGLNAKLSEREAELEKVRSENKKLRKHLRDKLAEKFDAEK